ncbi:MAG: hypothetical protein M3081_14590 [Gemmatimonadota bacterium]|nr:hypothetical protein [Gemmatimonadota bacterium]
MRIPVGVAIAVLAAACHSAADETLSERGRGLSVAELNAVDQAHAYEIAVRGAFHLESALVLLLNPAHLPRKRDAQPADSLAPGVIKELRSMDVIQGACDAVAPSPKRTPICEGTLAGYEVQLSDIFQVSPDTVQFYITAERFRPSSDTLHNQQPLKLEQRYTLVRRAMAWSVAKKERMSK